MEDKRFLEDASKWVHDLMIHYHYDRDDYWFGIIIMVLALLLFAFICYCVYSFIYDTIDKKTATLNTYTGKLVDKKYVGETDTDGTGTALVSTGNGIGVGVVSTHSHEDEKFLFFLDYGGIYKCKVDMQNYYHFKIGDNVKFSVLIGGKSGCNLETKLV